MGMSKASLLVMAVVASGVLVRPHTALAQQCRTSVLPDNTRSRVCVQSAQLTEDQHEAMMMEMQAAPAPRAAFPSAGTKALQMMDSAPRSASPFEGLESAVDPIAKIEKTIELADRVIQVSDNVFKLVAKGQPVSNVATQKVSVMPMGVNSWQEMTGWRGPIAKKITRKIYNKFGVAVASQTYTVAAYYGGQLNGHGQYLANIRVFASEIDLAYLHNLDSTIEVGEPLNIGTDVQNPVAGIDLAIHWKVANPMKVRQGSDVISLRGDGMIQQLVAE